MCAGVVVRENGVIGEGAHAGGGVDAGKVVVGEGTRMCGGVVVRANGVTGDGVHAGVGVPASGKVVGDVGMVCVGVMCLGCAMSDVGECCVMYGDDVVVGGDGVSGAVNEGVVCVVGE